MTTRSRYYYGEVLPFVAMILMQCVQVGLSTLFKAAAIDGMSYKVFIVYSYALSGLVLLPFAFIFERKKHLPPLNSDIAARIFLLGFLGFATQMLGFKGIEYSSPTLSSALSNLTPAFTFAFAIIFRMEKIQITSLSSQAKVSGTIISIAGALVVVLYAGPVVIRSYKGGSLFLNQSLRSSPQSNWIIGGVFLMADFLLFALWYIVQTHIVTRYPAELLVVSLYNLCVAIITAPVTFFLQRDISDWKISSNMMLYAILYAGFLGTSFATVILTWGLHLKGPVYVALFTPLQIVIAAVTSVIFLGDSLYLGSVIGAIVISVGFYICMWGKAKEEPTEDLSSGSLESGSAAAHVPLLQ